MTTLQASLEQMNRQLTHYLAEQELNLSAEQISKILKVKISLIDLINYIQINEKEMNEFYDTTFLRQI